MTSKAVARKLETTREILITTFDAAGKPGSVPVWFVFHQGRFHIVTARDSRKVRKLRADPKVVLTLTGARGGLSIEGTAEIVKDRQRLLEAMGLFQAKYGWREDNPSFVLLVVTPLEEI